MNFNVSVYIIFLVSFFSAPLSAQLSYGGNPMMNDSDFSAAKVIYMLPPEDPMYIEALKSKQKSASKPLEFAIERAVDLDPDFNGEWSFRDGRHIWRVHIISPEAHSIGVLFSSFQLNSKSSLFIYSPGGTHVKGGFTSQNNKKFGSFYVGHTPGEEIIVELQTSDPGRKYGELHIGSISHAFLPVFDEKLKGNTGLGESQDCEIDINCSEGDDWQIIKKSVVHITTINLLCTGALVNNTNYDGKPYVLTAEHCISKESQAGSSLFYFGYENSACGELDGKRDKSISGSYLLATGGPSATGVDRPIPDSLRVVDYTLLKLTESPPTDFDVYFAGWDARNTQHDGTVTIHHPNGDAKKISVDFENTVTPSTVPGDLNDYYVESNYYIRQWDLGTTEGGSSGCPLFNNSKRLIGVLSGGLAMCGDSIGYNAESDRVTYSLSGNEDDYFSKISYSWDYAEAWNDKLKAWLDQAGTGQLSIGGLSGRTLDYISDDAVRFSVYPNPSKGVFSLELPEYSGSDVLLEIFNISGYQVFSEEILSTYPLTVSVPELETGIYTLRLTDRSKVFTGTIIIHQ